MLREISVLKRVTETDGVSRRGAEDAEKNDHVGESGGSRSGSDGAAPPIPSSSALSAPLRENLFPVAVPISELEQIAWPALFGNEYPVELEIGIGKGGFLLRRAMENSHRNFFGIEWANEFYKYSVDRIERRRIRNVRITRTDALHFIRMQCPRDSLHVLHVYHPDPWPKKRHHKRRLFQQPFVDAAVTCLVPGGRWAVQTDHAEYFAIIRALLLGHPQLQEIPFEDADAGVFGDGVATNFEIKYRREGRAIYQIAMRRM